MKKRKTESKKKNFFQGVSNHATGVYNLVGQVGKNKDVNCCY